VLWIISRTLKMILMTRPFDLKSLKSPNVMTPLGVGTLMGADDKDNPKTVTVLVRVEGFKLRQAKAFDIAEVTEITGGKNGN
jgi:hypothetical protein